MRDVRDAAANDSETFREKCNFPSFGSSSVADTTMSEEALALQNNYPEGNMHQELDRTIYTRLLLCSATASAGYFRTTLSQLFPGAHFKEGHSESSHNSEALTISVAPVKGLERTLVKFDEYASEGDARQWPVTPQIRDTLRAKIEAPNGDALADATNTIMSTFDVREGNGRFKNNLMTQNHQPPNLLINLVLRPPSTPPITVEVQIYLRDIEKLNEHRYYEVRHRYDHLQLALSFACCTRLFERPRQRSCSLKGMLCWSSSNRKKKSEEGVIRCLGCSHTQ